MNSSSVSPRRVCLGAVAGAHGVRGLVKLRSFTEEPGAIAAYGPVQDEDGRSYTVTVTGRARHHLIARLDGVSDREAALALSGRKLYVERSRLPEVAQTDEFYREDLVGLAVETPDGRALGRVRAVENYGAGDILIIAAADGGELLLAFTRAAVPEVDVAGGRLVANPPPFDDDAGGDGDERG